MGCAGSGCELGGGVLVYGTNGANELGLVEVWVGRSGAGMLRAGRPRSWGAQYNQDNRCNRTSFRNSHLRFPNSSRPLTVIPI